MTTTKRRMIDPTMTTGLRRFFNAEIRRQYSRLRLDLVRYFESPDIYSQEVDGFSAWLQSRLNEHLVGPRQEQLWSMLVEEAFRRGVGRAYDDVIPKDFSKTKHDLDQASRAGFLRGIMGSGVQEVVIPTMNVERIKMPQVRKADWDEFLVFARERTTLDREDHLDPKMLKPIQTEFSQERVDQIPMEKLQYPILVSLDGYVMDGNHRWIKAKQTDTQIPVLRIGLEKWKALDLIRSFPKSEYVENALFGRVLSNLEMVKTLAKRAWTEFVGGVQGMANGLAKTFLDGQIRGATPKQVGREMSKQAERQRINTTTTVSDAVVGPFNEGMIVAFKPLGVTEVGVAVEWRVKRNEDGTIAKNVCGKCRDLEGIVITTQEASGLFPRHPRCQCALKPIIRLSKDSKTSRGSIISAIQRSRRQKKGKAAWGSRVKIAQRRPRITKNFLSDRIDMVLANVFCPTGPGGGVDPTCSPSGKAGTWPERLTQIQRMTKRQLAGHVSRLSGRGNEGVDDYMTLSRETLIGATELHERSHFAPETVTPQEWLDTYFDASRDQNRPIYNPNILADINGDGVTDHARVGVPADTVPPPPPMSRLPNLTPHERAVEQAFIDHYEKDPDKLAREFRQVLAKNAGGGPKTFGTDDAKEMVDVWSHPDQEIRLENRAKLNLALHQTANALTKRAFIQELDTLPPGSEVLVTVGGCGAGKGYALKNVPEALAMKKRSAVVWDSAGDQNATENPWIQREAEKRGMKVNYVYVHAHAETQWAHPQKGVVKRAGDVKDGRMVDAKVFADSYAIGAKNHAEFAKQNANNPHANFIYLDNNGKPELVKGMPKEALRVNRDKLYKFASESVMTMDVPDRVKHGATAGKRVWGVGS